MSLGLYRDVHVPMPITRGLRRRGAVAINAMPATANMAPVEGSGVGATFTWKADMG